MSVASDSAIQLHSKGRMSRSLTDEPEVPNIAEKFNLLNPHGVLEFIYNYGVLNLGDCCNKTWSKLLKYETNYIRIRSKTDKHFWGDVRQYRITGSRCYSLYTYNMKPRTDEEWNLKASKYFWPVKISNKYVQYGIKYENTARIIYEKEKNEHIFQCGCITWPNEPWLSYSPDGLILNEFNTPIKLIEIKCPFKGKSMNSQELIKNLSYINYNSDDTYQLKRKHMYYGQVQLGMVMTNVNNCDFIIYSSFEDKIVTFNVDIDIDFCKSLLLNLKVIYYEKMIHEICIIKKLISLYIISIFFNFNT